MGFTPFAPSTLTGLPEPSASLPEAGYTLINGTQNGILTWTAPNDGNPHFVLIVASLDVTVAETGGTLQVHYVDPAGTGGFPTLIAAAQAVGTHQALSGGVIGAGQTVSINQSSALTAGAATLWAAIYGV